MHQIAFTIFGHPIHSYGLSIALGFLAGTGMLVLKRKHADMKTDQIFDLAMLALIAGIVGARIFYVIQFWHQFSGDFFKIFKIWEGGLVFYGGLIMSFLTVCTYAFVKKKSIGAIIDITAPAITVGHAFGRIGCFLEGCCFGGKAPADAFAKVVYPLKSAAGARYPDYVNQCSLPVYPVQLFEADANFIFCAFILMLFKFTGRKKGMIAGIYLIVYAFIRFTLEFFRGDHTDSIMGLTPSQFIAFAVTLPLGVGIVIASIIFQNKNLPIETENEGNVK